MREKTVCVALAAGAVMAISGSAFAQAFAGQNFDIAPTSPSITSNAELVGGVLTGDGRVYAGTGPFDLGYTTLWTQTRNPPSTDMGVEGPLDRDNGFTDSSDFTGVTSFTGSNSPNNYVSGNQGYEFNDGDGRITVQFDPVDTTGQPSRFVNLHFWFAPTSWEAQEMFEVSVSDGMSSATLFSVVGDEFNMFQNADITPATWIFRSFEVPMGLGPNLTLSISGDQNSGSENMFIDSVEFSTIPTPGALALLGTGGLVALRRRRR